MQFLDAEKQNELYPDTFLLPRLDLVGIGCTLYVCIVDPQNESSERFWVKCVDIHHQTQKYICIVVNELSLFDLAIGDEIHISKKNILNIQTQEEVDETIEFGREKGIDVLYELIERYEEQVSLHPGLTCCNNHTHISPEINKPWTIKDLKEMQS